MVVVIALTHAYHPPFLSVLRPRSYRSRLLIMDNPNLPCGKVVPSWRLSDVKVLLKLVLESRTSRFKVVVVVFDAMVCFSLGP